MMMKPVNKGFRLYNFTLCHSQSHRGVNINADVISQVIRFSLGRKRDKNVLISAVLEDVIYYGLILFQL